MYYTRKLYNLLYFSEPYRTRFHIPFKILCANTDHFIVHSACLQHSTVTMRLDALFGCGHQKDDWNIHFLLESYAPASLSFVTQNPAKEGWHVSHLTA